MFADKLTTFADSITISRFVSSLPGAAGFGQDHFGYAQHHMAQPARLAGGKPQDVLSNRMPCGCRMCLGKPQQSEAIGSMVLLFFGNMDPINKNPLFVSIFLAAPWICHREWNRGAERRRSWTRERSTARAKRRSRAAKAACRAEAGRGQKGLWRGSGWHGTAIWVCLKIVYLEKPNGFADHYPY